MTKGCELRPRLPLPPDKKITFSPLADRVIFIEFCHTQGYNLDIVSCESNLTGG